MLSSVFSIAIALVIFVVGVGIPIYIFWIMPIRISKRLAIKMGMSKKSAINTAWACFIISWLMPLYLYTQLKTKEANDRSR